MTGSCRLAKEAECCDCIQFAHTAAVTAWTPIWSELFGVLIPTFSAVANATVTCYQSGRFVFKIAAGVTVARGAIIYYNTTNDDVQLTSPGASGFLLGQAVEAGSAVAGYVQVEIFKGSTSVAGGISVFGSDGKFKAAYQTIDLAVAALVEDDILKIGAGEYTLSAACDVLVPCQIIGEAGTAIIGAAGADYCFRTVLGAIASTKTVAFKNFELDHGDDNTQIGIEVANVGALARLNVEIEGVETNAKIATAHSVQVDHTVTTSAIRLYTKDCCFEGNIYFVVKNTDDRMRFEDCTLRGGLETSADAVACEVFLRHCMILHAGLVGGNSAHLLYALYCLTETDANPNVYALLDVDDSSGFTETVILPTS
jgi:hypothetical protein